MNKIKPTDQGLRAIALIKLFRGTAALIVGIILLRAESPLIIQYKIKNMISERADDPIMYFFLKDLKHINQTAIYSIGLLALIIATIRYIEAIGLWRKKRWAEWLALLTILAYVPFEIFHLAQSFSLLILLILILNLTACTYLLYMLRLKNFP